MRLAGDRTSILLENGLSEAQASAYLALLEVPWSAAGALARKADVPRNRLYEVLEELQALGLVEVTLGEVRQYRARPLGPYLERRAADMRRAAQTIEARQVALALAFQPAEDAAGFDPDTGDIKLVLTRRAVARELDRLVSESSTSLFGVASAGGAERLLRHLSQAHEDVALTLVAPRAAVADGFTQDYPPRVLAALRLVEHAPRCVSLVRDDEELLLIQPIPDDAALRNGRDFAILTTNPSFVRDHLGAYRAVAGAHD